MHFLHVLEQNRFVRFSDKSNLNQHLKAHPKQQQFKCVKCKEIFQEKAILLQHMQKIHDKMKLFECFLCKFWCTNIGKLKVHMLIHSGKKPFQCEACKKLFAYKNALKRHLLVHDLDTKHWTPNSNPRKSGKKYFWFLHIFRNKIDIWSQI